MADFTADLSAPSGAGAVPLNPVQPVTGNAPNPWANVVAAGANIFFKVKEQQAKEEKQKMEDSIISDFVRKNTALNDAVAAGQISRAEAAVRQRAIFSESAARNPTFVKTFGDLSKDLTAGTELGEFKEEEQSRQDQYRKLRSDAISAGLPIYDGMNPKTEEQFLVAHQRNVAREKEFEALSKRADEARKAESHEQSRFKFQADQTIASNLNKMGEEFMVPTMSFVSDLSTQSSTPEQRKVAMQKLTNHFALIDANIAKISSVNPSMASNWKGVYDELRKNGMELIDGTLDAKTYKAREESLKSRIVVAALENSATTQAMYANNHLMGPAASTLPTINKEVLSNLAFFSNIGGINGNLPSVVGSNTEGDTLKVIEKSVQELTNGTAAYPDMQKRQTANFIQNHLKQFSDMQMNGGDPKQLAKAMDFYSSPAFAQAMNLGMVNKDQAKITAQTNASYFEQKIAPLVEEKLSTPFKGLQSYGDLVDIKWGGASPVVMPLDRRLSAEQAETRNRIVTELKPAMDALAKVTRAGAHLEGHTDYAKFFEENKATWLPSYFKPDGSRIEVPGQERRGKIKGDVSVLQPQGQQQAQAKNWWE